MITPSPSTPRESPARTESRTDARSDVRTERRQEFREVLSRGREREEARSADRASDAERARDTRDDRRVLQTRAPADDAPQAESDRAQNSNGTEKASNSHDDVGKSAPERAVDGEPTPKSGTPAAREAAKTTADASESSTEETSVRVTLVPDHRLAAEAEAAPSGASDLTQVSFAAAAPGSARSAANTADADSDSATAANDASITQAQIVDAVESSTSNAETPGDELPNRPHESRTATTHDTRGANTFTIGAPGLVAEANSTPATAAAPQRLAPAELPQFLRNLAVRVDGNAGSALIELEPLDLGRMTVELTLQPEGGVRAEVRAERPDGLAAIEARLTELRASLIERGFASADIQLSLGLAQRDAGRENAPSTSRRGRKSADRELETERVLALSPKSAGSIDLWA